MIHQISLRMDVCVKNQWKFGMCVTSLRHFTVFIISSTSYSKAIIVFQGVWERCLHSYCTWAMGGCSIGDGTTWLEPSHSVLNVLLPSGPLTPTKKPVHSVFWLRSEYLFLNSSDRTTWLLEGGVGKHPEGDERWSICDTSFFTHCK
jgi:hypothetical protein